MSMSYIEAYPPRLTILLPPLNHSTRSTCLLHDGVTDSCVGVVVGAAVGCGVAVGLGVGFAVGRGVGFAIGFLDKYLV